MRRLRDKKLGGARVFRRARVVPVLIASLLFGSGVALAASGGLQNPGFEQGSGNQLDGWTLKAYQYDDSNVRSLVYGPGSPSGQPVPCDGANEGSLNGSPPNPSAFNPYGICVVQGADQFKTYSIGDQLYTERTVPVLKGSKMVRLGGPYQHKLIRQQTDGLAIEQTFTVDAANPVLHLNYNLASFDYIEFDELGLRVKLTSAGEPTIKETLDSSVDGNRRFKMSGWRNSDLDLTSYAGQQVKLEIEMRGTVDTVYPTWAYIDAEAGAAVDPPVVEPPVVTPPVVDPPVVTPPVVTPPVVIPPAVTPPPTADACAELKSKKKVHCKRVVKCKKLSGKKRGRCLKLVKRRKPCLTFKGKKKGACEKKARALSRCDGLKGKSQKKCMKKARKIKVK